MLVQPSRSTLFPYTTLFRSKREPRSRKGSPHGPKPATNRRSTILNFRNRKPRKSTSLTNRERRSLFSTSACREDRKSTRLNSSHSQISYAVFCLKKKKKNNS